MVKLLNDEHIRIFCDVLNINGNQIERIYINPGRSANNKNYVIVANGQSYLYSVPGPGTEKFCNREREALAYKMLAPLKITDEVIFIDKKTGVKISKYYEGSRIPDQNNKAELAASMQVLRTLHESDINFGYVDTLFDRMEKYYQFALEVGGEKYYLDGYENYLMQLRQFKNNIATSNNKICFTHGDASINNLLVTKEHSKPILIDMEFPAMSDPYDDVATFCIDAEFRTDNILLMLEYYLGRKPTLEEQYHILGLCAVAGMMWYSWATYKSAVEEDKKLFLDFRDAYHQYINEVYSDAQRIYMKL